MFVRNNPGIDYDNLEGLVQSVLDNSHVQDKQADLLLDLSLFEVPEMASDQSPALSAQALFDKQGEEFITQAYITCLGRMPDYDGLSSGLMRLASGESKQDIVMTLMISEEGMAKGRTLEGFTLSKRRRWLFENKEHPVLGKLLRWLLALSELTRMQRRLNQLEYRVWQQERQYLEQTTQWRKELLRVNQGVAAELQRLKEASDGKKKTL